MKCLGCKKEITKKNTNLNRYGKLCIRCIDCSNKRNKQSREYSLDGRRKKREEKKQFNKKLGKISNHELDIISEQYFIKNHINYENIPSFCSWNIDF